MAGKLLNLRKLGVTQRRKCKKLECGGFAGEIVFGSVGNLLPATLNRFFWQKPFSLEWNWTVLSERVSLGSDGRPWRELNLPWNLERGRESRMRPFVAPEDEWDEDSLWGPSATVSNPQRGLGLDARPLLLQSGDWTHVFFRSALCRPGVFPGPHRTFACGNTVFDLRRGVYRAHYQSPFEHWKTWLGSNGRPVVCRGLHAVVLGSNHFLTFRSTKVGLNVWKVCSETGEPIFLGKIETSSVPRAAVALSLRSRRDIFEAGEPSWVFVLGKEGAQLLELGASDQAVWCSRQSPISVSREVANFGVLECAFSDGRRLGISIRFRYTRSFYEILLPKSLADLCLDRILRDQQTQARN